MNDRANRVADELERDADRLRVAVSRVAGARVIDCGGAVPGGLTAGLLLARACLADLADVQIVPDAFGPAVQVRTDDPVRACLASQYAGWQVKTDNFFAMGSGPMRAAAGREEIFAHIPGKEDPAVAVGVLEAKRHPTDEVVAAVVAKLPPVVENSAIPSAGEKGSPPQLTLLVAPAASLAGTVQVVARSVETALHKLHELKFDVTQVVSGYGVAPLPPVARDELTAIGRTNDAILYGGRVTLWVRADDEQIAALGPQVPSSGSKDHGAPFAEIFARYGNFYQIDPLLFSPAEVTFVNLTTGRAFTFGKCEPDLLRRSYFGG